MVMGQVFADAGVSMVLAKEHVRQERHHTNNVSELIGYTLPRASHPRHQRAWRVLGTVPGCP
jgi:hypothetical protein